MIMKIMVRKLHVLRHIVMCALIMLNILINTSTVYAGNKDTTPKLVSTTSPLGYLNNMVNGSGEVSEQMKKAGNTAVGMSAEIYLMIRTVIFIMIMVFSIVGIIKIGIPGRKMRDEGKETIYKAGFALLCFGAMSGFIGMLWSIASSILI